MPHGCLPPTPATRPLQGPGGLEQCSNPNLLTDTMQTCFLQQLIPISSLASLAENLQSKRQQGGRWLQNNDLNNIYGQCGIPSNHWSRITNLLEKLAIVTAARP